MKILIVHNHYQIPGGEDAVVRSETALLQDYGHKVALYERSNVQIHSANPFQKLKHIHNLASSRQTYAEMKALIKQFQPDVAHFHNIFFVVTPSAYAACREEGVAVVQSQHNFRWLCANALFYRDNHVCEDCLKGSMWQGVQHGCYKNSRVLTFLITRMLLAHKKQGAWVHMVDLYITAAEFTRRKYIEGGVPADRIMVKPNFVYPETNGRNEDMGFALYVGRLSAEKGVDVLLKAWKSLPEVPLKIIGDGPAAVYLRRYARDNQINNVTFLGFSDAATYDNHMKGAKFLIIPSVCYENFPRIVVEAFSYGIPVLVSRLGSLEEIVHDHRTGRLFDPGDPDDLAQKAREMAASGFDRGAMVDEIRGVFQEKFTALRNHELLMAAYERAIAFSKKVSGCAKAISAQ